MLIAIGTYALFTIVMVYLLFRRDNRLRKKYQGDFYELKNKNCGLLDFQGHSAIEGCVMVVLSPITFILGCVANLQYFFANLKYYLRGGSEKRLGNVKEHVQSQIIQREESVKEMEELRRRGYYDEIPQTPEERERIWKLSYYSDWDLRDIVRNNSYQEFSQQYLGIPTPLKFWGVTVVSCLGLIFWPITAAIGIVFTVISIGVIAILLIFK